MSVFNSNPTIILGSLGALIQQILPLLVILGFIHPTPEQLAAYISLTGLLVGFVTTALLRSTVTPTAMSDQLVRAAVRMPNDSSLADVQAKVEAANG